MNRIMERVVESTCETCLATEFNTDFHRGPSFEEGIVLLKLFDASA